MSSEQEWSGFRETHAGDNPHCDICRWLVTTLETARNDPEAMFRANLTPDYCTCDYAPVRGIEAGRHLPSCHFGIIDDFLSSVPPKVKIGG